MSLFLSVKLDFESLEIAQQYFELLDKTTRPIFEEDVPPQSVKQFKAIDEQEFADVVELNGNALTLWWFDKERFDFPHLVPMLKLGEAKLVLAFEVSSYGDASDEDEEDGWFWVPSPTSKTKFSKINKKEAVSATSKETVRELLDTKE